MVKYRCVKADSVSNVIRDGGRTYVEDGIVNARKRAMKMIHGDRRDSVLIWVASDFKKSEWIGYLEKIYVDDDDKHIYYAIKSKGTYTLNPNGSVKEKVW